jgi:protein gp37
MKTTKIDWCDATVNPVVGCSRGCDYCYARRMNARFGWVKDFSKPQFFPERLKAFDCKTPKSIFVNSMSDIHDWDEKQIDCVFEAITRNPQHNYIFLTKSNWLPDRAYLWTDGINSNIFFGKTITSPKSILDYGFDFWSIEPIHGAIGIDISVLNRTWGRNARLKAVIIGAETGNRKGKVIPRKEWIDDIVCAAGNCGLAVFMKESLRGLMGGDFRQDPLPWDIGGGL